VKARKRILTGIRPTRPLHLGHYAGALEKLREALDLGYLEKFRKS
jgi:tryptophanyl-tRNA synthetase